MSPSISSGFSAEIPADIISLDFVAVNTKVPDFVLNVLTGDRVLQTVRDLEGLKRRTQGLEPGQFASEQTATHTAIGVTPADDTPCRP